MLDSQITINPESSDFYRPTEQHRRSGLPALLIKLSGGRLTEEGANRVLLAFAIIIFIVSIIILAATL